MPLHGVGLIVGGTIAVLGSGYVFKKYIYDPHLGPYIEALLAQHHFLHTDPPRPHRSQSSAEPIPVAVSARTTARETGRTKLRRRSKRNSEEDLEMREGLLSAGEREGQYMLQEDLDDRAMKDREGRRPPVGSGSTQDGAQPPHIRDPSTAAQSDLIDLHSESIISPQDAEVRSVIFNYPSPPLTRSNTPSIRLAAETYPSIYTVTAPPELRLSPNTQRAGLAADIPGVTSNGTEAGVASTTFSFLSLSQASSPEVPTRMLDSWANEGDTVRTQEDRQEEDHGMKDLEDDLISHPGTAVSDYIDAETYTPFGERSISPSYPAFPNLPFSGLPPSKAGLENPHGEIATTDRDGEARGTEMIPEDLGLSFVRLRNLDRTLAEGQRRGPMSVVSLSESDEGGSEDWEAV